MYIIIIMTLLYFTVLGCLTLPVILSCLCPHDCSDCFAIQRQFEAGNSTAVNGYSLGIIRTRSGLLYTPQCNPNGTFTQVQCNSPMNGSAMNSEVTFTCWCVDPATGMPTDEYPTNSYARKHASECTYINTTEGCMVRAGAPARHKPYLTYNFNACILQLPGMHTHPM